MNAEALRQDHPERRGVVLQPLARRLWRKGESSGHVQQVLEMRVDCDQDAVWIRVEQAGAACHTGRHSCFYRRIDRDADGVPVLIGVDAERLFDPAKVYPK